MSKIQQVIDIVNAAAIYVPDGCEGQRVDAVVEDEGYFHSTGEESGETYTVYFDDVDLDNDLFYKLALIEVDR